MAVSIQKADVWKRISAALLDIILVFTLAISATLFFASFSGYRTHLDVLNAETVRYQQKFEQETGIRLDITQEEYDALSENQQKLYNDTYEQFSNELAQSENVKNAYKEIISIFITCGSLGLLVGYLVVYFVIPVLLKNGQTLGKKCFGLAVVRSSCVKLTNPVLFIRCFVGYYAIEAMFPAFLVVMTLLGQLGSVGVFTFIAFFVLQIGVMIYSPTNSCIHDLLSDAIVVDIASQFVFENYDELAEYEKNEALQKANEQEQSIN